MIRTELEIAGITTIDELVTFLLSKKGGELSSVEKEMLKLPKSIKTPQFRAVTALGDAVKSSVELVIYLSAAIAKIEAFSKLSRKILKSGNSVVLIEKTFEKYPGYQYPLYQGTHLSGYGHLKFYSVAARKANASGSFFAAFKTNVLRNLNIFVGSQRMNETKLSDAMSS